MSVAAKISVTILNAIFDVCMCSMISVLLDICICALFGHAEFGVLVRHNCGAGILANSHCSGGRVARNTLEWENAVDMAATATRVSKQAPRMDGAD